MSLLTQPWFWTALISGSVLIVLFFFAYHVHTKKEHIYKSHLQGMPLGAKAPADPSDIANYMLHGKRTFRLGNLFYALAAAYFHKD